MRIKCCILLAVVSVLSLSVCKGQYVNAADTISREKANDVLLQYFNVYLSTNKVLLFSISDITYYVIVEKDSLYEEYMLIVDSARPCGPTLIGSPRKPHAILRRAFCTDIYHREFVTQVVNPKVQQGNLAYFVLRDVNGDRYGEFREAVIIKPPPIDEEVYAYILGRVAYECK